MGRTRRRARIGSGVDGQTDGTDVEFVNVVNVVVKVVKESLTLHDECEILPA